MKTIFDISGMSCSACSARVENAVSKLDGVSQCSVNLLANTMVVNGDASALDIITAVEKAGYGAKIHDNNIKSNNKKTDTKLIKLITSVVLLCVLMVVAMGHMFGLHINPAVSVITQIVLTGIIALLNFHYFSSGFSALIKLSPNMDTLIALGSSASIIYSIVAIFVTENYIHNLYFESASMILTFVSVGKYFESRSKAKTTQAISKLIELAPDESRVLRDGVEITVPTEKVKIGDIVIFKSGERISVDGEISDGHGFTDESSLTGESMPVIKYIGDKVFCGTILSNGYIKVKAEKIKGDTTLDRIISLVQEAASSKAPIARTADIVSRFFVPAIIALSIITTIVWNIFSSDFALALSFGIAVLVISCPCALGLATPTAIMVSTGVAAQNSILIKSSQALEILSNTKNIVFDKTGTITEGKPKVVDIIATTNINSDELLKIAASLEKMSDHPLSHAVVSSYNSQDYYYVEDFKEVLSKGLSGRINKDTYKIGTPAFANTQNISVNLINKGVTKLYLSKNKELIGVICVADNIKDSSIFAIEKFNKMGINTYMLTGDNADTANYVKEITGVQNIYSELMPDDKEKIVRKLKEKGVTVMVGDGINDSPALICADVGIAIGAGTDIAIDSADVILTKNSLADVLTAVELSKKTLKNIKENLFWAFIYNLIFIPVAAGVFYNSLHIRMAPMYGTIAMSLSSICVVSNALRLKLFKPKYKYKEKKNNMKTMVIEGMMCVRCKAHVENALNAIEGVTATVDLDRKTATIITEVSDDILKKAVTDAGYDVISIK